MATASTNVKKVSAAVGCLVGVAVAGPVGAHLGGALGMGTGLFLSAAASKFIEKATESGIEGIFGELLPDALNEYVEGINRVEKEKRGSDIERTLILAIRNSVKKRSGGHHGELLKFWCDALTKITEDPKRCASFFAKPPNFEPGGDAWKQEALSSLADPETLTNLLWQDIDNFLSSVPDNIQLVETSWKDFKFRSAAKKTAQMPKSERKQILLSQRDAILAEMRKEFANEIVKDDIARDKSFTYLLTFIADSNKSIGQDVKDIKIQLSEFIAKQDRKNQVALLSGVGAEQLIEELSVQLEKHATAIVKRVDERADGIELRLEDGFAELKTVIQETRSVGIALIESNLPPNLAHYIDRPTLMAQIRESLVKKQGVSLQAQLTAHGGFGKSVLAFAYGQTARRNGEYPGGAFIVRCEGRTIAEGLSELLIANGETLKLSNEDKSKIVGKLLAAQPSLVIFDNIESKDQWITYRNSGLLPSSDILITTQSRDVSGMASISVEHLTLDETRELLAKFSLSALLPSNADAIQTIHKETEGLAVLVAAVGVAQREANDPNDWRPYAEWLKTAPTNQMPVDDDNQYPNKTEAILDKLLEKLPPAQIRILEYAAILPPDRIRKSWLVWLLAEDAKSATSPLDLGTDPTGASRNSDWHLNQLRSWDVLRPMDEDEQIWSVHRLYRKRVIETILSEDVKAQDVVTNLEALDTEIWKGTIRAYELSHITLSLDLCNQQIDILENISFYQKLSPNSMHHFAGVIMNRGNAYKDAQNLDAAFADYTWAIEIMNVLRATLVQQGHWHPHYQNDLAKAYVNRGNVFQSAPNLGAAIADYSQAIEIRYGLRATLVKQGQWHPEFQNDLAKAHINRGVAYDSDQDLDAAIADYTKAIEIMDGLRRTLVKQGQWHPQFQNDLAKAHINRAVVYRNTQDLNAALADDTRAIEIMDGLRRTLVKQGQWHPQFQNDLATSYGNRGNTYDIAKKLDAAIADYTKAIEIRDDLRATLVQQGQWHPQFQNDLANAYMNRGVARTRWQNFDLAITDFSSAIDIADGLRKILVAQGFWHRGLRQEFVKILRNRAFAYEQFGQSDLDASDRQAAAKVEAIDGP